MSTRALTESTKSNIDVFKITSNYGGGITENFGPKCSDLRIYESVFDSTVRVKAIFTDAGYNESGMTSHDELFNLTGGEKTEIVVTDNYEQKLEFTDDYHLRVRKHQREQYSTPSNTYVTYHADFYSCESLDNHDEEKRAYRKYEGFPHEEIMTLLKDDLKTPKEVEVDNTVISYNFSGGSSKVFHCCTNLCNKGCPKDPGVLAGYLFYEVAKGTGSTGGYRYKSIDLLFEQKPKKKYIFNNTGAIGAPEGYDGNIINFYENVSVNVDSEVLSGATFQRSLRRWDPYLKKFVEDVFDHEQQNKVSNNAGEEFHKIAADKNFQKKTTRISSKISDGSAIPHGRTWAEQAKHSKKLDGLGNYQIDQLVRQATDRSNQLLGIQITALIPMDLSLHVGDLVEIDFPQVDQKKDEKNKNRSGIYMILDLAHRITPKTNYTSLHLSKDSTVYKK